MGKTVAREHVPYVPCSKMKPCDLGSISKSLEAAMGRLEALRRGYDNGVHTKKATRSHGVPREPKPPDLYQGEHLPPFECSKSSPTFRGKGNTPLLPFFNGENTRAFVSWLYDVECYFKNKCFSDKEKCKLVVSCLKGVALLWHNTLNYSRRMEGKGRINSWFKLEKSMRLKFLPCSTLDDLWAELKILKQNSLSVHEYAKLFEELHFVCDNEVSPFLRGIRFYNGLNPEIAKQIKLDMKCSFSKVLIMALRIEYNLERPEISDSLAKEGDLEAMKTDGTKEGLSQRVVMPYLDSLESKDKEVLREGVSDVLAPNKEEESAPTHSTQILVEKEHKGELGACSSNYLSPLELSINKKLQRPLSLKMDGFLTFEGEVCWDSIKGKAKRKSWVVPCSSVPNLTSYISHGLCFATNILGGITCALSTPHFHFYMLIRLQVNLVHLSANSYILKVENGEMNQVKSCCPVLKFLCFEDGLDRNLCGGLLGLFGTSRTRSLHDLEGVVAHLGLFRVSPIHKNRNSPMKALLNSNGDVLCLGLDLSEHEMLVLECQLSKVQSRASLGPDLFKNFGDKRVFDPGGTRHPTTLKDGDNCLSGHTWLVTQLKVRAKQSRPWDDGYMSSIEREGRMGISGDNEPFMAMKLPTLLVEFEGGTHIRPSQATMDLIQRRIKGAWMGEQSECGNGTTHLLPFTILVYDPGGSQERTHLLKCAWSFDKWEDTSLGNKSLQFEPTEFEDKFF